MYKRKLYMEKIRPYINKPVIKVVTGIRRAGKSSLLKLIMEELKADSVKPDRICYINMEFLDFDHIRSYRELHQEVKARFNGMDGRKYLFIDEIQEIENWEKAVASFFSQEDTDIYITGSNAGLLSSDLATLLSGRYIEFQVFPLSFREFLQFRNQENPDVDSEFQKYLKFGGFPAIHYFDINEEVIYQYISSLYDTILLKDVIGRHHVRNVNLLENITRYIFDNIGNIFSAKKVSNYLKSQKLKIGLETVQNYISYLVSTYAVYRAPRYDVKGKRLLEFHEKYYLGDIGLRHALLGYREGDISGILENIVFLELKRRGYRVYIGKLNELEIDFIAEKENEKCYIQTAYMLSSPETVERETAVLKRIDDNYPKYVLSLDTAIGDDFNGIRRINLVDFLLENR